MRAKVVATDTCAYFQQTWDKLDYHNGFNLMADRKDLDNNLDILRFMFGERIF